MKLALLSWLASPCCRAVLRFVSLENLPLSETSEIVEGQLACNVCRRQYPILEGAPRLAPGTQKDPRVVKTRESFAWEWQRYPGSLPEDEKIFQEEVQILKHEFKGKLVLDAGCGMGRYSLVALSWGAEVVALDLSESLLRLSSLSPQQPKLHVVQGDLLCPPFQKEIFDIVYSHGVLHHTSDTKAALSSVAELVKPGGLMNVWLYGKAGHLSDFATNPLREDRAYLSRHRRLAWMVVAVRHFISDFLRVMTTRLPMALTYAFCWPLAVLGKLPGIKYLTFSVHPQFMVRVIENFDWLSPPFQYHHTKEELGSWYQEAGFTILKVLPHGLVPKPGILGKKNKHA